MITSFSAGLWYNSMIKMNIKKYRKRQMKYGVISTSNIYLSITTNIFHSYYNY